MAEYLTRQGVSAVVDATHPFAARITANVVLACQRTTTPLLVVRRPAWIPVDGDQWTTVPDLAAAAAAVSRIPADTAVLLTTGRQDAEAFATAPQRFWLRAVDRPTGPLPIHCELILERGPFTLDGELDLFRRLAIDLLVTKNSGGPMTAAKLSAARHLGLPMIMVDRPPLPDGIQPIPDVTSALTWLGVARPPTSQV